MSNKSLFKTVLFVALCLCLNSLYAIPEVKKDVIGDVKIIGTGTFKTTVLVPLFIHEVAPEEVNNYIFVKGANYDLMYKKGSSFIYPSAQYTIWGQNGRNVYISTTQTLNKTSVSGNLQGSGSAQYNAEKDDGRGVVIQMLWWIYDADNKQSGIIYDGNDKVGHKMYPKSESDNTNGEIALEVSYLTVKIAPDAINGDHIFTQEITVSYTPF